VRRLVARDDRAFKSVLDRARLPATVRLTRGRDIAAACGHAATT
jgi:adenine C2-methylase RlmN of 23S rRNA A2503 and tRNA A37